MRPAVVIVLALVLPALAGCFAADDPGVVTNRLPAALSAERFKGLPGESSRIEASSDGASLHLRVFRPDAPEDWKAPVILVMSSYFGPTNRENPNDPASKPLRAGWLVDRFVPRGYAVAYLDIRGTGESGGCLEQTAHLQAQDGYDVVEHLAAQPWSSGRVGTFGKSYDGEAQQATATLAPPSLATIVPVDSVSGQYEYGFYDGVPYTTQTFDSNFGYMLSDGLELPSTQEGFAAFPSRAGCHPGMLAKGLDFSGDWDDYWESREFRKNAANVRASVLYVQGLQDWNVKPVAIRDWLDKIPSEKRAILGQWAHDYPHQNTYEPSWSRHDWVDIVHRWYDHWLLGLDNGILADLPPVSVQDSSGVWRRETAFPPTDAEPLTFHLAPGALTATATTFDPIPMRENEEAFLAGATGLPIPTVPPPFAPPNDLLVFDGEPLPANLHMSGWPIVRMNFTVTDSLTGRTDPHFAFVLSTVAPDGKATWINRGYLSARHREGVENPQPVPAGETIEYTIRFFPQDDVVKAGHRLRLTLAGSDAWTQPEGSAWAGTLRDATLSLPVISRDWDAVRLDVPMGEPLDEPRP